MAGGGRLTGRQKMINLMYLVFIAMMALNVDREVVRSFETINTSLESTTTLTELNNGTFYKQIDNKAKEDPTYAKTQAEAADVKKQTNDFVAYIAGLKKELAGADFVSGSEDTDYNSLSNTEPIVSLFFKGKGGDKGNEKAQEFTSKVEAYKNFLMPFAQKSPDSKNAIASVNEFFGTAAKSKNQTWVQEKFYDQPMVASLTNLSKMQMDARTQEGNLVRALLSGKLEEKIELDAFQGLFLSPGVVKVGDEAVLNVVLGAYDNSVKGSVSTSVGSAQVVDGKASIKLNTGSVGLHTLTGSITYVANGQTKTATITPSTYQVVAQTLDKKAAEIIEKDPTGGSIVADNLRVVYRGVTNPISATINGANGPVSLSVSSGSASGAGANKWNYTAGGGSEVVFTASARASSGKTLSVRETFRVKPVPPARGVILGKTSPSIPDNGIAAQTIRIDWPDFLFPISGEVTSFNVKVPGQPTVRVNGSKMSAAAGAISKAKKGDIIGVFEIKYRTNSGVNGEASSIAIQVQ